MNRIYKVLWSTSRNTWIAAGELAKAQGKSRGAVSSTSSPSAPRVGTLLLAAGLSVPAAPALAELPGSGTISAGSGSISSDGTDMLVTQSSDRMSVNWLSFSIGKDNSVTFEQPSASSIALNRVTGSDVSSIQGALSANGRVFLINPNGVLFNPTAQVNVGGLVASTLELSDEDFLAGRHTFEGDSTAAVINEGAIRAAQGGAVALVAARIVNEGSIEAPGGTVAMGSGSRVTLDLGGPVKLRVEKGALNGLIEQGGAIEAGGGQVYLTAKAAGELASSVINHTGVTEARTLASGENGEIVLLGDMDNGEVNVAGTLDASAPEGGDGGFIETSAARVKVADGTAITTLAADGATGTWLIDPNDYTIAESGGDISGDTLSSQLDSNNVTIQSADGATDGNGDIFVNHSVSWSANTLTLSADRNIEINAEMNASNAAGLALEYNQADGGGDYFVNAPVNLASTGSFSTKDGSAGGAVQYTIITSLGAQGSDTGADLQGMNGDLSGNYVLGADIDAGETAGWNSGAGFDPVGAFNNEFMGRFDGLGHTISDLTINRPDASRVGLFRSTTGATLRNVGLVGGSVTGDDYVGGLVGHNNSSTISNVYATGSVSGDDDVGGLVGDNDSSTISNAYATVNVTGSTHVGGLVGDNDSSTISNAYATGSVSGTGDIGGLVGYSDSSTISNAYATGRVSGDFAVGGLVGANDNDPSSVVKGAYWNTETSGQSSGIGVDRNGQTVTGLTTAEMQNPFTFIDAGWDFSTWGKSNNTDTPENSGYMMLRGVGVSGALYDDYVKLSETSKTYGDTNPELTDIRLDGVGTDNVSLEWGSAITNTTNAGTYAYSGAGVLDVTTTSANGVYVDYGTGGLTIDKAALTVTAKDVDKTYDGQAFTGGNGVTYAGFVAGEDESVLNGGLSFVGDAQGAVNAGSYSLTAAGLAADNYDISYTGGTLTVNQATIANITGIIAEDKTYDGTTGATLDASGAGFTGIVSGDTLTVATASGAFADKNAGSGKTVTISGLTLGGDDAGNYTLADDTASANADIDQASLTLSTDDVTKTYDGTTTADGTATVVGGDLFGDDSLAGGSFAFTDRNAGTGKTVTVADVTLNDGNGGDNYIVTYADNTNSAIDQAALTLSSADVTKAYDGTTEADGTATVVAGQLFGDDSLSGGSFAFTDRNAGTGKTVTVADIEVNDGNGGDNYSVTYADNTTSTIDKAALTVTANDANKTYDGQAFTGGNGVSYAGFVAGEDESVLNGSLSFGGDAQNAVNAGSYSLTADGLAADNYDISYADGTLTVNQATIAAITGIIAEDKTYDGTTDATLDASGAGFTGIVAGDTLTVATASGAFADKNAGSDKTVSISGLALGGDDAGNYTLAGDTATTSADIGKTSIAAITGIAAEDKTYDGTTAATLDASGAGFTGMVSGDTLTVATASGAFADKNAGSDKTVNISGLTL
ncbi:YDG domain-containing protein, partial [Microbulbifer sp.]|uniref:YDG domain-containing protein n=1 Tax=Microbulbifer sp. TaxID=1908541 RepID=UPI003F32AD24